MTRDFNNLLEEDLAGRALSVGQIVDGTVVQISEDGVFVDIGAKSEGHLELDQIFQEELARLQVGDQLKVRIIKRVDGEYKLSKKSVDYEQAWNQLIEDRQADRDVDVKVVEKVKNGYMCEAYGVLQGFIHHTNFKGRPTVGQAYKARILDLNRKARKLVFTRRDILKREQEEALERDYGLLQEGMVIEGVVDKLSPYGAFVKITDNLTGLLHISEFSFEHVKKPSEVLKPNDVVQVKILSIDRTNNRISLSRKATMKDPLMTLLPGEELDGKVESLADFGIFVRLDNGVTGLVHISELSHRRFNHPSEIVKPNDPIRVKVLRVQPDERRVSLSAKACERDPWSEVYSRYTVGQKVDGHVVQLLQSGAVVKLDDFFEAFVPISEISEERIGHPSDVLSEEQEINGVVLTIDTGKRRIRVSLRRSEEDFVEEPSPKAAARGTTTGKVEDLAATAGKVTLGDILGSKLDLTMAGKGKTPPDQPEPQAEPEDIPVVSSVAPEEALAGNTAADSTPAESIEQVDEPAEAPDAEEVATAESTAEETEEADVEAAAVEEPATPAEEEPEPAADSGAEPAVEEEAAAPAADDEEPADEAETAETASEELAVDTASDETSDETPAAAEDGAEPGEPEEGDTDAADSKQAEALSTE